MNSHRGLNFNLEESDTSGAISPHFSAAEPDVGKGSKNLKESSHPLEPNHDHTIPKKPEHVYNSSDCDEVDETEVGNGFLTLSREESKEKVNSRLVRFRASKRRKICSAEIEERGSAPSAENSACRRGSPEQNEASIIIQKERGKEEMGKSISPDIASCTQSPITNTSSENSAGRARLIGRVYSDSSSVFSGTCSDLSLILNTSSETSAGRIRMLCKAESSSDSVSSPICSRSKMDQIVMSMHQLMAAKSLKKQNELMEDFGISKNRYSDNPGYVHKETDKSEEMRKGILAETSNGAQSPIPTTSSITSEGITRMSWKVDSTCTSESSNNYSISELDPIDERNRNKFLGKKSLKKENKSMNVLRICKTLCSDNPRAVQQKMDKNVEKNRCISTKTASGTQTPIQSTSSGNYKGMRMFYRVDKTTNFASSNTFSSSKETCAGRKMLYHEDTPSTSSTDKSAETAKLIKLEKCKLREQENRKKERELTEKLRLLIPRVSNNPKASKAVILLSARKYIDKYKQNLETKEKRIEDERKKFSSLEQEFKNLMQ